MTLNYVTTETSCMARWQWNFKTLALWAVFLVAIPFFAPMRGYATAPQGANTISIRDDRGKEIRLDHPAKRIIALYGAFNEIIAALGEEQRIIARTKADESPPSITTLPVIGTHMRPNIELVLSLSPDLIVQNMGRKRALEPVKALERQGLNVVVFDMNSLEGLYSAILRLGRLMGCEGRAQALVSHMKGEIEAIRKRSEKWRRRPKVFFEVRYPNLLGAGGTNIVSQIIEIAGGENCFASVKKKFVRPNIEAVIECDPDLYLIQKGPMNRSPGNPVDRPNFKVIRAIREGRWRIVPEELYSRPTPNIVKAMEALQEMLSPLGAPQVSSKN